jgi:hypothetical protein
MGCSLLLIWCEKRGLSIGSLLQRLYCSATIVEYIIA